MARFSPLLFLALFIGFFAYACSDRKSSSVLGGLYDVGGKLHPRGDYAKNEALRGESFYYGRSMEKDEELGLDCLSAALACGYAPAKSSLDIIQKDMRAKAARGNLQATYLLGIILLPNSSIFLNDKDAKEGLVCLERAAERGYLRSQYRLSQIFLNGSGVEKNEAKSLKWLKRAAVNGHADAQFELGEVHYYGRDMGNIYPHFDFPDMKKNEAKGIASLQLAAAGGHSYAQASLGKILYYAKGDKNNKDKALKLLNLAAKRGDSLAQWTLGVIYYDGDGVEVNQTLGIEYLRRSALGGDTDAQCYLGKIIRDGDGIEKNEKEGLKWLQRAADGGHAEAQMILKGELDDSGDAESEVYQAMLLYYGYGIEKDEARGLELLELAVGKGDAEAQLHLGSILHYEKDEARGIELLQLAADSGNIEALGSIGNILYSKNDATEVDKASGFKLLESAAACGDVASQYILCATLIYERGMKIKEIEALPWFKKAVANGENGLRDYLVELSAQGETEAAP